MTKFIPFTPLVLAFAQELLRRNLSNPTVTLQDALQAMLDEKPALKAADCQPMASQMNDLMHLAEPGPDDLRLAMMVFLPNRRGCLFTMQNIPVAEAQQFRSSPFADVGASLASALDANWPEVLKVVDTIPTVRPLRLVGADGLPAETHHPAAAGPQRGDVTRFLRP